MLKFFQKDSYSIYICLRSGRSKAILFRCSITLCAYKHCVTFFKDFFIFCRIEVKKDNVVVICNKYIWRLYITVDYRRRRTVKFFKYYTKLWYIFFDWIFTQTAFVNFIRERIARNIFFDYCKNGSVSAVSSQKTEEQTSEQEITYTPYTVSQLMSDFDTNALRTVCWINRKAECHWQWRKIYRYCIRRWRIWIYRRYLLYKVRWTESGNNVCINRRYTGCKRKNNRCGRCFGILFKYWWNSETVRQ